MYRKIKSLLILCVLIFAQPAFAGGDDISPEFPFNVETTDMAENTTFTMHISARGNFTIDWGDPDGTNNIQTITRTGTSRGTYSHTYTSGGEHTIKIGGLATGYNTGDVAAIDFDGNKNIVGIYGSVGRIFPTINDGDASGEQPRFYNLFHLCTNITSPIPADLFADVHGAPVSMMFRGVFDMSSTTEIVLSGEIPPNLFENIRGAPAPHVFRSTFYGCAGLTGEIPENLFVGLSGAPAEYMFYNTFYNNSGLTGTIPENLFVDISGAPMEYMYSYTFAGAGVTGEIPENLFAGVSGAPAANMFMGTFKDCAGLTGEIPENLFAGISGAPAENMFSNLFYGCVGLTGNVPENLFAGISGAPAAGMFSATFQSCGGLTGYVPYKLFAAIDGVGLGTVTGFTNTFLSDNNMDKNCPAGMSALIKPDNGWRVAFCGGCLFGQYMENDACKNCPAGYAVADGLGASVQDCKIRCSGGSYLANARDKQCSDVGNDFYAPESLVSYGQTSLRYSCPAGLKTPGYGNGADAENDCGKVLHLGENNVLYVHRDKRTSPSFAVMVGNQTFYADMGINRRGYLRTAYGDNMYSIYDEKDGYGTISDLYTPLNYIESHGYAYIDTGFLPSLDLDIYYLASIPEVYDDQKTAVYWIEQGSGKQYYASAFVADKTHIRAYRKNTGGPTIYTVIENPGTRLIEWQTRGNTFFINGKQYLFDGPESGEFGNYRLFVLGKNKTGKLDTSDAGFIVDGIRLYRWRLEQNGETLQDLVPVRRNSDGEIGMYDMVTGEFFGNMHTSGYFSGE